MNAYLVLDLAIHDLEKFHEYIIKIPAVIEKHADRYIVQGEEPEVIEGDWNPERIVIIEFPSRAKAKELLQDPEAQTLLQLRHQTTTSKLVLVDGCNQRKN